MQPDDSLSINVMLAGRSYRIRVQATQEGAVRKAVRAADDQIKDLRRHYAGKDDQDFIAMCLLMYAAERGTTPELVAEDVLEALTQKIAQALRLGE